MSISSSIPLAATLATPERRRTWLRSVPSPDQVVPGPGPGPGPGAVPAVVAAPWVIVVAWLASQALGTAINFTVLRGLVFR